MYSRSCLEEENEEQSPDSTRPEHPVVTDACVRALECPSLPHPPKAHLARLSREGQTHAMNRSAFHRQDRLHCLEIALRECYDRPPIIGTSRGGA
jgi:hypothetical protein